MPVHKNGELDFRHCIVRKNSQCVMKVNGQCLMKVNSQCVRKVIFVKIWYI